jgi:sugar phosphate isomerase/epimerase
MGSIASQIADRRTFLAAAATSVGAASMRGLTGVSAVAAPNWSPADIRYGYSGIGWGTNVQEAVSETARMGLQGLEGHGPDWAAWFDRRLELKKLFDASGIAMVSCSRDLNFFVRPTRGAPATFVAEDKIPKMIEDHVAFARDFIKPFGCKHFKFTLGGRPETGPNDAQIKIIAQALNEIGKRTAAFGMKLAPHPHIGATVILEHELRTLMDLTDPRYVWLVTDTAHLALAGMDPLAIIREYYPRIAEVHYKDAPVRFRHQDNPVPSGDRDPVTGENFFQPMGTGGVDFPAIHAFLLGKKYKGWILLDYLPPRPGDGIGSFEQSIAHNKNYLVDVLKVKTLGPTVLGHSSCEYGCMAGPTAR